MARPAFQLCVTEGARSRLSLRGRARLGCSLRLSGAANRRRTATACAPVGRSARSIAPPPRHALAGRRIRHQPTGDRHDDRGEDRQPLANDDIRAEGVDGKDDGRRIEAAVGVDERAPGHRLGASAARGERQFAGGAGFALRRAIVALSLRLVTPDRHDLDPASRADEARHDPARDRDHDGGEDRRA